MAAKPPPPSSTDEQPSTTTTTTTHLSHLSHLSHLLLLLPLSLLLLLLVCPAAVVGQVVRGYTFASVTTTAQWYTITMDYAFTNPVVVCTPEFTATPADPIVIRLRNIESTQFEFRLADVSNSDANTGSGSAVDIIEVRCVVVEDGVFPGAYESHRYNTSLVDTSDDVNGGGTEPSHGYIGTDYTYVESYTTPIVIGAVQTSNMDNYQVFWAAGALLDDTRDAPTGSDTTVSTGRHSGETRLALLDETIGFVVFEAATVTIDNIAVTANRVGGVQGERTDSAGVASALSGLPDVAGAAACLNGIAGLDGAFAYILALSSSSITVTLDEDKATNAERGHTALETVAYVVVASPSASATPSITVTVTPTPTPVSATPSPTPTISPGTARSCSTTYATSTSMATLAASTTNKDSESVAGEDICALCLNTGAPVICDGTSRDCPHYNQHVTFADVAVGSYECCPCAAGAVKWSLGFQFTCATCPTGLVRRDESELFFDDFCTTCDIAGTEAASDSATCDSCPTGMVLAGGSECFSCPANAKPNDTSSGCDTCAGNQIVSGGGCTTPTCDAVGAFLSTSLGGQSACLLCSPGSSSAASHTTDCSPGAGTGDYIDASFSSTAVPAGRFAPDIGSRSAAEDAPQCWDGAVSTGSGRTTCTACDDKKEPNGGFDACTSCVAGFFSVLGMPQCEQCPYGRYQDTADRSSCSFCPADGTSRRYLDPAPADTNLLATVCPTCPDGHVNPSTRMSTFCLACATGLYETSNWCSRCPAGKATPSEALTGATSCEDCPAGKYAAEVGNGAGTNAGMPCALCWVGTYQDATGQSTCKHCPAGRFNDGTSSDPVIECTGCGVGYYGPTVGQSHCVACEAGRYSNTPAVTSCTDVTPGSYAPAPAETSETPCPEGTYSFGHAFTACATCPQGYFNNGTGVTICTSCPAGFYDDSDSDGLYCSLCPDGRYAPSTLTALSACLDCPAGFSTDAAITASPVDTCTACPAGTFSSSPGGTCTGCPSGKFIGYEGGTTCEDCPFNAIANTTGLSACFFCAPNTVRQTATSCAACNGETFTLYDGGAACYTCPDGTVLNEGSCGSCGGRSITEGTTCTECAAGSVVVTSEKGVQSCLNCTAGFAQIGTDVICSSCTSGYTAPSEGATVCTACTAGTIAAGSSCSDCTPGFFTDTPASTGSCTSCPGNTESGTGASVCTDCTHGSITEEGVSCAACPVGRYHSNSSDTFCTQCAVGLFANDTGSTACAACPEGKFTDILSSTVCTDCVAGWAVNTTGQTVCEECTGNTKAPTGSSECIDCAPGFITVEDDCLACPQGQYHASVDALECSDCITGLFANETGLSACFSCDPGKYSPSNASESCTDCSAGLITNTSAATVCTDCVDNTVAIIDGLSVCSVCTAGEFAASNKQSCELCSAGYYLDSAIDTVCISCTAGWFSLASAPNCTQCSAGFTAKFNASTTCDSCTIGSYSPAGHGVDCISCGDLNTVALVAEATACTTCDPGFITVRGEACDACETGRYHESTSSTRCVDCTAGLFAADTNATACDNCPLGFVSTDSASTVCTQCAVGEYMPSLGASLCLSCGDNNTFSNTTAASTCLTCDVGTTVHFRLTSCVECEATTFHAATTDTGCTTCSVGTFANAGATVCSNCTVGRFYDSVTGECSDCPAGEFQADGGLTYCDVCDVATNEFQASPAQSFCDTCGAGTRSTGTICVECSAGTFHNDASDSFCTDCPAGFFSNDTATTGCYTCDVGTFAGSTGLSVCEQCRSGLVGPSTGLTTCAQCADNSIASNVGLTACTNCTHGLIVSSAEDKQLCRECLTGTYHASVADTVCTVCEVGLFGNTTGLTVCFQCSPGLIQPATESVSCDACESGLFAAGDGATVCDACTNNTFSDDGASVCSNCDPGSVHDNHRPPCSQCDVGLFHPATTATHCESCTVGRFAEGSGAFGDCTACPIGEFQDQANSDFCSPCTAGLYNPSTAASVCLQCNWDNNEVPDLDLSATACVFCPAGHLTEGSALAPAASCVACAEGRFHASENATVCTVCPDGTFQSASGKSVCETCPLGETTTGETATSKLACTACEVGTYGVLDGTSGYPICSTCPNNTVTEDTGRTVCTECDQDNGFFQLDHITCVQCEPLSRQYQDLVQLKCVTCDDGHRITSTAIEDLAYDGTGPIPCEACPAGTFQSSNDPTACTDCVEGFFSVAAASVVCENCNDADGKDAAGVFLYADELAAENAVATLDRTGCIKCEAGTFSSSAVIDGVERSVCEACAAGFVSTSSDSSTCFECASGVFENGLRTECLTCPPAGVDCSQRELTILQGYWWDTAQYSNITSTTPLYQCLATEACVTNSTNSSVACRDGHEGVLCATCAADFSLDTLSDLCSPCRSAVQQMMLVVFVGLGVMAGSVFIVYRSGTQDVNSEVTPLFRIFVNYFNAITVLNTLEIRMDSPLESVTESLLSADPSAATLAPSKCILGWTFKNELYVYLALPPFLWILSAIISGCFRLVTSDPWSSVQALLVFYYLVFNRLATVFFTVLDLHSTAIDGTKYMRADFTVSDDDSQADVLLFRYSFMRALAIAGLVAYVLLPPAITLIILARYRKRLLSRALKPVRFLYMGYQLGPEVMGAIPKHQQRCRCCIRGRRNQCSRTTYRIGDIRRFRSPRWFWEFVVMGRKLALLCIASLSNFSNEPYLQLFSTFLLLGLALAVHLFAQPYQHSVCDVSETAALASLLLNQGFVMLWYQYQQAGDTGAMSFIQWAAFVVNGLTLIFLAVIVLHFATQGTKYAFITRCKCLPRSWRTQPPMTNTRRAVVPSTGRKVVS